VITAKIAPIVPKIKSTQPLVLNFGHQCAATSKTQLAESSARGKWIIIGCSKLVAVEIVLIIWEIILHFLSFINYKWK
jgi:hypothetical protein